MRLEHPWAPADPGVRTARKRERHLLLGLSLAVFMFSSIGGCSPQAELGQALDLVQAFGSADVSAESALIDIGVPEGGSHLLSGWSWNEKSVDGTTFVWSSREESVLEFFLAEGRMLDVRLRCLAYPFRDGELQTMTVAVNGSGVAEFEVSSSWREFDFKVPADVVVPGNNEMTFRYGRVTGSGGDAGRRLGVAFDRLLFLGAESATPRAITENELLSLGSGSRVDYFFEAPAGAVLSTDEIVFRGVEEGRLTIELERDGGPGGVVAEITESSGPKQWPLGRQGGIFRLRFEVSSAGSGEKTSIVLSRPIVLAPGPEPASGPRGGFETPYEQLIGEGRPSVILYVVDTLRADHLGVYGYELPVSPELDRFATESVTFDAAFAQAPWTLPAMASVFTGLGPRTHNANTKESRLPSEVETLAELMRAAGYSTGAVVANGFVSQTFGFDQGFDGFKLLPHLETRAEQVLAEAAGWLDTANGRQPIFLFLHSIDPHDSYDPPRQFRPEMTADPGNENVGTRDGMKVLKGSAASPEPEQLARLLSLYDGEVAYTDWAFGQFVEELRQRGLYESSLIIFMSDHGEEFFEHGSWLHGHTLHSELIDVPLMLRFPNALHAGTRVAAPVQQVDLIPTLVEYLGLEAPSGLEGRSLLTHVGAESGRGEGAKPEPVVSYLENRWVSIVLGNWKLIARPKGGKLKRRALYDRIRDPQETRNLAAERPVLAGFLSFSIAKHFLTQQRQLASAKADIDREMEERLKALGYLD